MAALCNRDLLSTASCNTRHDIAPPMRYKDCKELGLPPCIECAHTGVFTYDTCWVKYYARWIIEPYGNMFGESLVPFLIEKYWLSSQEPYTTYLRNAIKHYAPEHLHLCDTVLLLR